MLETELENLRAQLSRFKLHLASVSEDVLRMEDQLSSTIANLKKTQVGDTHTSRAAWPMES